MPSFMKSVLGFYAAIFLICSATAVAITKRETCDAQRRIDLAVQAVDAILKPTAQESTAAYQAYPFTPDARIILNPNEIGDIQVSNSKDSTVGFLGVIYQVVTSVRVDKYLNIDESHTFFNVTGDLGLLHQIPLPAKVFFDVFLTYTLEPCELEVIHVYAQVPSEILGLYIDLPTGLSPTPEAPQE